MPETTFEEGGPASDQESQRTAEILAAACKVIARAGAGRLSLDEVAREAGVSKALVLYYFRSRKRLLARAYLFADARGLSRVREQVESLPTAAQRLAAILRLYFEPDPEIDEEWILWSELTAGAVFEPELRDAAQQAFAAFSTWLAGIIEEAIVEGSADPDTDSHLAALELMGLIDGLGGLVHCGLASHEQAQAIVSRALQRQLRRAGPERSDEGAAAQELSTFTRALLGRLSDTIRDLGELAGTSGDAQAAEQTSRIAESASRLVARAILTAGQDDAL